VRHVHQLGRAAGAARHPPCGLVGAAAGAQMSLPAMNIVWAAVITPPTLKLVALALADWCNDHGGSLHPSLAAVAKKVGVSRCQAQRLVQTLKAKGLLSVVANAHGGSRGDTPRYQLHLDAFATLTSIASDTGSAHAITRVAPMHRTGSTGATQTTIEPSLNQERKAALPPALLTPKSKSKSKSKAERRKDMTLGAWIAELDGADAVPPGDPIFAYALAIGLPPEYLELAWLAFRRRYLEEQAEKTYADWRATFRNAVRGNWLRLWFADPAGGFRLTTAGTQALRERDAQHSPEEVGHA
jgi:hypothetical protein